MFTIIVIYLAKTSMLCFISEVGTGSSSHDLMAISRCDLISVTQVGSNTHESLQCGCVCDRMADTGVKERRMFSIFVTKSLKMHLRGPDRSVQMELWVYETAFQQC